MKGFWVPSVDDGGKRSEKLWRMISVVEDGLTVIWSLSLLNRVEETG
jgi:hypothetical protein